jgi:hypothetical protein
VSATRARLVLVACAAAWAGAGGCRGPDRAVLFDGKSLAGWAGNPTWTVKDGAIDFTGNAGRGTLLVSAGDYSDFRLTVRSRLVSEKNHLGVCFWGKREPDHGYGECILVIPPSGGMWDYHPGKRGPPRTNLANPKFDAHQWHHSEILAKRSTGQVRMAVDGVELIRYQDEDPARLEHGPIGLQAHAGESRVQYKDVEIEVNPRQPDKLLSVKD